jgi:hypothetical protein
MRQVLFLSLLGALFTLTSVQATNVSPATDYSTLEQWMALRDQQVTTETTSSEASAVVTKAAYYGRYCSWRCYARNRYGNVYSAVSGDQWSAQSCAMDNCFYYNHACRPLGCDPVW